MIQCAVDHINETHEDPDKFYAQEQKLDTGPQKPAINVDEKQTGALKKAEGNGLMFETYHKKAPYPTPSNHTMLTTSNIT